MKIPKIFIWWVFLLHLPISLIWSLNTFPISDWKKWNKESEEMGDNKESYISYVIGKINYHINEF